MAVTAQVAGSFDSPAGSSYLRAITGRPWRKGR